MQPCDCLKPTMDVKPGIGRARAGYGSMLTGARGVGCCCNRQQGVGAIEVSNSVIGWGAVGVLAWLLLKKK